MEFLSCFKPTPPEARVVRRPTERLAAEPPRPGWPAEEPPRARRSGGRKTAPRRDVAAPPARVDDRAAACDCFPAPPEPPKHPCQDQVAEIAA